jgi:hypothetical protein
VFENKLLRRTFECNKEEVAGGWKILHDERLHNLFVFCTNVVREINTKNGACSMHIQFWSENLKREGYMGEIISKLYLREIWCEDVNLIELTQGRVI